jgi:hypothetical protein
MTGVDLGAFYGLDGSPFLLGSLLDPFVSILDDTYYTFI